MFRFTSVLLVALIISACGGDDQQQSDQPTNPVESKSEPEPTKPPLKEDQFTEANASTISSDSDNPCNDGYSPITWKDRDSFSQKCLRTDIHKIDLGTLKKGVIPLGLTQFENLTELILDGNALKNLSGLPLLPKLERLDLSFNNIASVTDLPALPELRELNLSYNQLTDLTGIPHLKKLRAINLSNNLLNRVKALRPLKPNEVLLEINLAANQFKSVSGIQLIFPYLDKLDLSGNQLQDVSGLEKYQRMTELSLSRNPLDKKLVQDLAGKLPRVRVVF